MNIPVTSSSVDLSLLHPRFVARLEAFFADPRIEGKVKVVSGCRSYAKQQYFYKKYKSGRGNLAANPDRRFGPNGFWRGSWHMEQDDGYCYAVDFRIVGGKIATWEVNNIAKEYGMHPTVASEWWHHQPRNSQGWFDTTEVKETAEIKKETKPDLKAIAEYIEALGKQVAKTPVRYRSRGQAVKIVQQRLNTHGYDVGKADGIFGKKTRKQVKNFQRVEMLTQDGVVGKQTWDRLINPQWA